MGKTLFVCVCLCVYVFVCALSLLLTVSFLASFRHTYHTSQDNETLLTISVGYADGMRRVPGNRVAVNGVLCDVVGRVTMDAIIAKVPRGSESATAGAKYVELIGDTWTADDVAKGNQKFRLFGIV